MMYRIFASMVAVSVLFTAAGQTTAAIIVHTSDFIADGSRSHFNGFEGMAVNLYDGSVPYTEDTIRVVQVNGDAGNDIHTGDGFFWTGDAGSHQWYPTVGDHGYTMVSLAGGIDFQSVGFNYGTGGNTPLTILYDLLDNGSVVLSDSADLVSTVNYLGFSGGGFDTIRMRDTYRGAGGTVTDGSWQTLAIDNIETLDSAVPEPASLAIWSVIGLAGIGIGAWRRRRKA